MNNFSQEEMIEEKGKAKIQALPGAVFLDRDGTINQDNGYISHPEDFNIYPFAGEAIKIFNDLGLYVFIVTNQSGIARGYYTFEDLERIHSNMNKQLADYDAKVDMIYLSPYYHEGVIEPYNIAHQDRKPGLGMYYRAKDDFPFDPKHSFMIGDRYSDIEFGKRAGLKTILLLTGEGEKEFYDNRTNWEYEPDYIVKDLLVAAKLISKLLTS